MESFKTLAENGKQILQELVEERKQFILRNNEYQRIIAQNLIELLSKPSSTKDDMTPRFGVDEKNLLKHIEESPEKKNDTDPK